MQDSVPRVTVPAADLTALKTLVDTLVAKAAPPSVEADEQIETGELLAISEWLTRIDKQIRELHPLPSDKGRKANGKKDDPKTPKAILAGLRSTLDDIENRLSEALPRRSSGRIHNRFHGTARVSKADGEAIRADVHGLGKEGTFLKWSNDGPRGVPGGQGKYTKRQVQATLSHDAGGHRRRRRRRQTNQDAENAPAASSTAA